MRILLLGSGGREHAFAHSISKSGQLDKLFIAPGNPGTASLGENVDLSIADFPSIGAFCLAQKIEMILVGPEAPLVEGIYDYFQSNKLLSGISVIGPSKEGAQLEGSKAFAKSFMAKYDIPTASYREFSKETEGEALDYIAGLTPPIVLKADGLAAGKGVLILEDNTEAQSAFSEMVDGKFGNASAKVVIEAFLDGIEFSVFALTDGKEYQIFPVAKDYKRIGEGDKGLMTGGMGAVSPPPFVDAALMEKVESRIVKPTIEGIQKEGFPYHGFVFFGLIRVGNDPYVIEYNCRMGDPETEVVLPRIKNDFIDLLKAVRDGGLGATSIEIEEQSCVTVMLVSGGYPEAYEKGKVMEGVNEVEGSIVYHAGTKMKGSQLVTNGGRVMAITSFGENHKKALAISNQNVKKIQFEGKNYRKDIGFDL